MADLWHLTTTALQLTKAPRTAPSPTVEPCYTGEPSKHLLAQPAWPPSPAASGAGALTALLVDSLLSFSH